MSHVNHLHGWPRNASEDPVYQVVSFGDELFRIEASRPREGSPPWANLKFRPKPCEPALFGGGGIYAILYDRELLYIGKYTGKGRQPFAGDVVRDRFWKHLEALTLRGTSISFSAANYDASVAIPDCVPAKDLAGFRALRGVDRVRTYPEKVRFAGEHWPTFLRLETDQSALRKFAFGYARLSPRAVSPQLSYAELTNYLEAVEDQLIEKHAPRCNVKRKASSQKAVAVGPVFDSWTAFGTWIELGQGTH